MNSVVLGCPMCGRESELELTNEEVMGYFQYREGMDLIQVCLPTLKSYEREFIKTGYCPECQKLLFGCGEVTEKFHYFK